MKKLTTNLLYVESMVLAAGSIGCGGAIEHCENGWVMLAWTLAALILGAGSLVLAGLGVSSETDSRKIHKPQKNTVRPARQNRRGA